MRWLREMALVNVHTALHKAQWQAQGWSFINYSVHKLPLKQAQPIMYPIIRMHFIVSGFAFVELKFVLSRCEFSFYVSLFGNSKWKLLFRHSRSPARRELFSVHNRIIIGYRGVVIIIIKFRRFISALYSKQLFWTDIVLKTRRFAGSTEKQHNLHSLSRSPDTCTLILIKLFPTCRFNFCQSFSFFFFLFIIYKNFYSVFPHFLSSCDTKNGSQEKRSTNECSLSVGHLQD